MTRTAILLFLGTGLVWADERTQRLAIRLAEEASAFQRIAPQVLGVETLEQRAQKPPGGFRIRIGKAATGPAEPEWQQRKIVSEYAHEFESLRAWFQALYEVLLGQSQGPRFGSFVELYGVAETRAMMAEKLGLKEAAKAGA
jgi:lysyl-tRNA synthetase class I